LALRLRRQRPIVPFYSHFKIKAIASDMTKMDGSNKTANHVHDTNNRKLKSNYKVISTPLDGGPLPTVGVVLWLGWTGAPILIFISAQLLPRNTRSLVFTTLIGLMIASLLLPRSFGSVGDKIGAWIMKQAEAYFGLTTTIEDEQALLDIGNLPLDSSSHVCFYLALVSRAGALAGKLVGRVVCAAGVCTHVFCSHAARGTNDV
jgi:hypothetical protein